MSEDACSDMSGDQQQNMQTGKLNTWKLLFCNDPVFHLSFWVNLSNVFLADQQLSPAPETPLIGKEQSPIKYRVASVLSYYYNSFNN
jgi:hypothetical protein